jgi:hypothetical protein
MSPASPASPDTDTGSFPGKLDMSKRPPVSGSTTPARTRSILNLTSSTLFGIYQPTTDGPDADGTPFGSGAQTPAVDSRHGSFDFTRSHRPAEVSALNNGSFKKTHQPRPPQPKPRKQTLSAQVLPLVVRDVVLLATGVLYGLLVSHLHDRQQIAPVKLDINRLSLPYLGAWAIAGLVLGEALPWLDRLLTASNHDESGHNPTTGEKQDHVDRRNKMPRGWNEVIRPVGMFVGISFAIRKLPWQSTQQLSLTLALANPALWYLIDRSFSGFILPSAISIVGTTILVALNPSLVPASAPLGYEASFLARNATGLLAGPSAELVMGVFSPEFVGVWTWIASVLFVSSVCFGNIGRQLTPRRA